MITATRPAQMWTLPKVPNFLVLTFYYSIIMTKISFMFLPFFHYLGFLNLTRAETSVVDPKLFIPDPDPAFNFPSSGFGSRQKFRIHADPDPTYIN